MSAVLRVSEDPVKVDLELICDDCGENLCDAQDGDELGVLVAVVDHHNLTRHAPPCAACGADGGHYPNCPDRTVDEVRIGGYNERKQ